MAIQQLLQVSLLLTGDGSSSVFTYSLNQLFALTATGESIINPATLPNAAQLVDPDGVLPSGTASLDGFGNLVLTFASSWASGVVGTATVQLLYNSGTLGGTTQAWTSATALNSTWTLPLNGSNAITLGIVADGTLTAGSLVFETSQDGANWFSVQGSVTTNFQILTSWAVTQGSLAINFNVAGFSYFRVLLNPVISGSGTVTFIIQNVSASVVSDVSVGQSDGTNLHATLDDAAGGNAVNTVVKGTQAARALGVQDLKDSGRTPVILYVDSIAGVTTEALATMNINKGGTVSTATEYTVTTGKTLRVQSMFISCRATSAAMVSARARLRSAATVAATSPIFCLGEASSLSATTAASNGTDIAIPDGVEIAGGQQVGISQIATATTADVTALIVGYEY